MTAVFEKCMGMYVSSTQVSGAAKLPGEELTAWRERRLGRVCVQQEFLRRTRVGSLFCNEDALLRLGSAVLMELDTRWFSQWQRCITWEDTSTPLAKARSRFPERFPEKMLRDRNDQFHFYLQTTRGFSSLPCQRFGASR
ncbi:MAG: hypothetical protein Q8O14_01330 [bacterium]|nr:hypothetical protein [bacterium]